MFSSYHIAWNLRLKSIFFNSILPVLAAFFLGVIIILFVGENPISTYYQMLSLSLFHLDGILRTLHVAAPLILTGLAIAITFKANIFNMGVEGQALLGGFFAGIVGAQARNISPTLNVAFCLFVGIASGMAFAMIPAILKAFFHVNEMVVTLMLNYAASESLTFLSEGVFRDNAAGYVATPVIRKSAMFLKLGRGDLTAFFFISFSIFILMYFIMKYTKLGYEIIAIGKNSQFAEAIGARVHRKIIIIMLLSGGISGLAGAGWMQSERFRYTLNFSGSPGLGWDGMLISLLGAHDPIGVVIAALFYSALKVGMSKIELFTEVPREIVSVIQGLMILFLSVRYITYDARLRDIFRRESI
jgi:simple sugar transport system permease protein